MNSYIILAVIILLCAIAYILWSFKGSEKFVSQRAKELYSAKTAFDSTGGNITFSDLKSSVKDLDAVEYTDIRNLWKTSKFTPEHIQTVL